jgi:predicted Rossmann fold flavoprotein
MSNKNIAIIGGGASGLIAGIISASKGHKVTIFEKNNKLGKKLLATGNGRCNITNQNIKLSNFHSQNIDFVSKILNQFSLNDTLEFFKSIGLLTISLQKSNRLYPMSLQSSSVVSLLELKLKMLKVQIKLSSHITNIQYDDIFTLTINNSLEYDYDKVIIATGLLAQPKLGGSKDGLDFAVQFKHNIIPTSPTLVQLVSDFQYLNQLSGVKFYGKSSLFINKQKITESKGDILFTKYGLSGSAILEISREVSIQLHKNSFIEVHLDLLPQFTKNQLEKLLQNGIKLNGILNQKLANFLLTTYKNDISKIINKIKNLKLKITNTKGFEFAEVCAGGVDLKEINSKTMQSLKQKDLYFCGEVLDVDGDCGGFNLQWAWSSGFLAGDSI